MLQFNNVPNETGGSLYANNIPRTATGTPMIISQDYSQNSSGDSVTFGSGGSPYQNRDVVSQQKYNLKTSV